MKLKNTYLLYFNFISIFLISLLNQRQDGILMQCCVIIFVITGLFLNLKTMVLNPLKNKVFNFSFLLAFIIFFSTIINQPIINWVYYLCYSLFPLILFNVNIIFFSKNIDKKLKYFKFLVIMIVILASFQIYNVSKVLAEQRGYEFQSNWANLIGSCLPIIFLIKQRKIQFIYMLFMSVFLFIGLKRTGLVALGVSVVTFIFFVVENGSVQFNFKKAILSLILITSLILVFFKEGSYSKIDRAFKRFEAIGKDGGSGRNDIFEVGISNWIKESETSLPFKIIGRSRGGFENDSIIGLKLYSAHNDLIDIVYDYGFISFVLLLLYYLHLVKLLIREWKNRNPYFPFIFSTCSIFFIYSNLSGFYHYFFFFCPLIVCLALVENLNLNSNKSTNFNIF